jgi:hypothetical protein
MDSWVVTDRASFERVASDAPAGAGDPLERRPVGHHPRVHRFLERRRT